MKKKTLTCGEFLVKQLEAYGIDTVFGIPGVHTIELYRGVVDTNLRHITPRHEQGAGFMADGYARITGRPASCFIITGPGMTNILTAAAQAYADSIPMLIISTVNEVSSLGQEFGKLHELRNQSSLISEVTAFSHTIYSPNELPFALAKAFTFFNTERPRPVHIQIPIDVMEMDASHLIIQQDTYPKKPIINLEDLVEVDRLIKKSKKPFLFLGGGSSRVDRDHIINIAEYYGLPILNTINAKGIVPKEHPLLIGTYLSSKSVREEIKNADIILAVGTELSETDYDAVFDKGFILTGKMIRVDIDPKQLDNNYLVHFKINATAESFFDRLNNYIKNNAHDTNSERKKRAEILIKKIRKQLSSELPKEWYKQIKLINTIYNVIPNARFIGDSTQLVYSGNFLFEADFPRQWFNASTGFGTLGYSLPAAIGAKIAIPDTPIIVLVGDGGFQFTLSELATAVEEKLNLIVILWNNNGYQEIKRFMENADITPVGVDLYTPDFLMIAEGFGCSTAVLSNLEQTESLLRDALLRDYPTVILVDEKQYYLNH